jgi:hypothetical protein
VEGGWSGDGGKFSWEKVRVEADSWWSARYLKGTTYFGGAATFGG